MCRRISGESAATGTYLLYVGIDKPYGRHPACASWLALLRLRWFEEKDVLYQKKKHIVGNPNRFLFFILLFYVVFYFETTWEPYAMRIGSILVGEHPCRRDGFHPYVSTRNPGAGTKDGKKKKDNTSPLKKT